MRLQISALMFAAFALAACGERATVDGATGYGSKPLLVQPHKTLFPTIMVSKAVGWPEGGKPIAGPGLTVTRAADKLSHPRWLYILPNGDVLVAESNAPPKPDDGKGVKSKVQHMVMATAGAAPPSANRITLLRSTKHDGVYDVRTVFLKDLHSPFGMTLVGNTFYVADSDALVKFPYEDGQTTITAAPVKVTDLPGGTINHHWTKNVVANADGSKLYVTVGSNSNVGENGAAAEEGRADVWEVDPATGAHRVYAFGLRNANGADWSTDGKLWVAVNERDELGSDLVPDYMTSLTDGGFYGWPYSYYGQHVDSRPSPQRPDLVAKAIKPDYALGAHTASLGLVFHHGAGLGGFADGAIIGQHGSWNRNPQAGYKVIFVPFVDGKPSGAGPFDLLTGFLNDKGQAQGRPVGVAVDKTGALFVADDVGNVVWRVTGAG